MARRKGYGRRNGASLGKLAMAGLVGGAVDSALIVPLLGGSSPLVRGVAGIVLSQVGLFGKLGKQAGQALVVTAAFDFGQKLGSGFSISGLLGGAQQQLSYA